MNKLKAYDKLCNFVRPGSVWRNCILSETSQVFVRDSLAFCTSKGLNSVLSETSCPKPLESEQVFVWNLWQPYRAPPVTLYFHKYTVYSTVQASKHKMTWFFCSQNQEWAMCALKQTVTKAGGCLFLWSDSIPKHASLKNVLIDLWNKYNLRDCPSLR